MLKLLHSPAEKGIGEKRVFITLNSGRKLFMVSSKKYSLGFEQGNPAADFKSLSAFVYNY